MLSRYYTRKWHWSFALFCMRCFKFTFILTRYLGPSELQIDRESNSKWTRQHLNWIDFINDVACEVRIQLERLTRVNVAALFSGCRDVIAVESSTQEESYKYLRKLNVACTSNFLLSIQLIKFMQFFMLE